MSSLERQYCRAYSNAQCFETPNICWQAAESSRRILASHAEFTGLAGRRFAAAAASFSEFARLEDTRFYVSAPKEREKDLSRRSRNGASPIFRTRDNNSKKRNDLSYSYYTPHFCRFSLLRIYRGFYRSLIFHFSVHAECNKEKPSPRGGDLKYRLMLIDESGKK